MELKFTWKKAISWSQKTIGNRLLVAAESGDVDAVNGLLRQGAPVDYHDPYGWTALHYAAFHGRLSIVRRLAAIGANVDFPHRRGEERLSRREPGIESTTFGWTPIMCASAAGHTDIVKLLLRESRRWHQDNLQTSGYRYKPSTRAAADGATDWTAAHLAAYAGHLDVIKELGEQEWNRHIHQMITPLTVALAANQSRVAEFLVASGKWRSFPLALSQTDPTELETAINCGHYEIAEKLIRSVGEQSRALARRNNKLLRDAAKRGTLQCAGNPAGWEENLHLKYLNHSDERGWSALACALDAGQERLAELLIAYGADTPIRWIEPRHFLSPSLLLSGLAQRSGMRKLAHKIYLQEEREEEHYQIQRDRMPTF